ncbi:MAG: hypothetical protein QXS85_04830 [Acidilobaceae archaeon]
MVSRVADEVLERRSRAGPIHASRAVLAAKALLLLAAAVAPLVAPLLLALAVFLALATVLALMGLRASLAYVASSTLFVTASGLLLSLVLDGDPSRAVRFGLSAGSSLSAALIVLATTKPGVFRSHPPLYVALLIIDEVVRETADTYTSLRARGLEGWRLYVAVAVDSMVRVFARSEALVDSLKSRGVEVSD